MTQTPENRPAASDSSLTTVFEEHRSRLERMIEFRLDERLRGRVDPEDIMQEAFIEADRRYAEYVSRPAVSVYVWLRQITYQCLIDVQRRHFGKKRDPRQEVGPSPKTADGTSLCILSAFFSDQTTPSEALMRQEEREQLTQLLAEMDEIDREVLALRHFEQLSNNQIAETLGISVTAASNRYIRAMSRLSRIASDRGPEGRDAR